jgi:hypothetical protein
LRELMFSLRVLKEAVRNPNFAQPPDKQAD